MLKLMRSPGLCVMALLLPILARAARPTDCAQGARTFLPCEVTFEWHSGDLPNGVDPYRSETLRVEFRSPNHKTYLMRAFSDGSQTLRVRFSPTEPGAWTYHVTGPIARYNDKESNFEVASSGLPGFFAVANVRHWWTTNKQPHLWLSAAAPLLSLQAAQFEQWLDARKQDGFTHIRGTLLSNDGSLHPLGKDGFPNQDYFTGLDERLMAESNHGFGVHLIVT